MPQLLVPSAWNPLAQLSLDRQKILDEVTYRVLQSLPHDPCQLEDFVTDCIFWERKRLEKPSDPVKDADDAVFLKSITEIYKTTKDDSRILQNIIEKTVRFHLDEILGHFNEHTYKIATTLVPRGLSLLLQAANWKSFKNQLQEKVDLRRSLIIQGQLDQLRTLAQKGTVILVPTHFSNLDSLLMGWALFDIGLPPFCYGAGLNLFLNPVLGYFMNNLGAYKIDRRKKHHIYLETLKNYSSVVLERGCHSLFFPGGGRSRSGGLESKLKLGLLGTGLHAYIENLLKGHARPNIYIVPCVISYHFVLEASSLIEEYLAEQGKHRFLIETDEFSKFREIFQFLYKFFKASSKIYLNFGQALDPIGHLVDENGNSMDSHGRIIDLTKFVHTNGIICHQQQRDHEYTDILGTRLLARFSEENIALTSHFIAYVYFEFLKHKHPKIDVYQLFRFTEEETVASLTEITQFATPLLEKLQQQYKAGVLHLEPALRSIEFRNVLETGLRNLGIYHTKRPMKLVHTPHGDILTSEDVKLLFYYHNRMGDYGLLK